MTECSQTCLMVSMITSEEVAEMMGLSSSRAVSVYRRRAGFPQPAFAKGACMLWNRHDIEAWCRANKGRTPERIARFYSEQDPT